jgi:UDP-glucose 4-epimerase
VVVDFIRKLKKNPQELEVLGDGEQSKSYLHVEDLIEAVFLALKCFILTRKTFEVYNVGSLDRVDVKSIAEIVAEEVGLRNLKLKFTGGVDGGRGWKGDVKSMQLSVNKLLSLGWKPTLNSEEAIRASCRELLQYL